MRFSLFFALTFPLFCQSPSEQAFIQTQQGSASATGQYQLIRAGASGAPLARLTLAAHSVLLGTGIALTNSGTITVPTVNAYTDSLQAAGVTHTEANTDMDLFIPGSAKANQITFYDSAWQHVIADGMDIKLNMSVNENPAAGLSTTSQFTKDACTVGGVATCDTSTGTCSATHPCFDTFAHWQAYYLDASGPVATLLTRWGGTTAGQGMNTSLIAVSLAHELGQLTCSALNPNWTSGSQCTALNWQNFGIAAVTLIRGIAAGTCTNCPASATTPMDISIAMLLATDGAYYVPGTCGANCVCGTASTLTSCGADIYCTPTSTCSTFYSTNIAAFMAGNKLASGVSVVEEWNPWQWGPSYAQSGGTAYRDGSHIDFQRYGTNQDNIKASTLYFATHGFSRLAVFDDYKFFWYAVQPSCPNGPNVLPTACGAPNLACGTNGLQCFGDISTQNPFITNVANQLTGVGKGVTMLGQWYGLLSSLWPISGSF